VKQEMSAEKFGFENSKTSASELYENSIVK
jgi:hypothetical protein